MSARPYLPCREIIAFLADYLDGTLDPAARAEFDRHLAVCPSCVAYLASYAATIRMAKAAAGDADSGDPPEELVEAILEATRRG
jgi:anti-sigma factor RsiW